MRFSNIVKGACGPQPLPSPSLFDSTSQKPRNPKQNSSLRARRERNSRRGKILEQTEEGKAGNNPVRIVLVPPPRIRLCRRSTPALIVVQFGPCPPGASRSAGGNTHRTLKAGSSCCRCSRTHKAFSQTGGSHREGFLEEVVPELSQKKRGGQGILGRGKPVPAGGADRQFGRSSRLRGARGAPDRRASCAG